MCAAVKYRGFIAVRLFYLCIAGVLVEARYSVSTHCHVRNSVASTGHILLVVVFYLAQTQSFFVPQTGIKHLKAIQRMYWQRHE